MGGEKQRMPVRTDKRMGSPPRGRGKGKSKRTLQSKRGITPAWAGKSQRSAAVTFPSEDHPRVGGEKCGEFCKDFLGLGSPPRGRGKVKLLSLIGVTDRITPAWAGKSRRTVCGVFRPEDHPRVGGEKFGVVIRMIAAVGSPPRGRGKDKEEAHKIIDRRITPAWAGKSYPRPQCFSSPRDHPRVGGEKTKKIP